MIETYTRGHKRGRLWAALFLTITTLLSACDGPETIPAAATSTPPASVEATPSPLPEQEPAGDNYYEPFAPAITVSTLRVIDPVYTYQPGDTLEDNLWTRAYRDRLGVNFSTAWTGEEYDLEEALETMAASDTLPDYMVLPYDQFYSLASRDMLEPLDGAVDTYAHPSVREALNLYDGAALQVASYRGALYGITSAPPREGMILWYRDDWAELAGFTGGPATFEDVIGMMEAFAGMDVPPTEDANTGDKAENSDALSGEEVPVAAEKAFGLWLNKNLFAGEYGYPTGLEGFFSAYGAYPTQWQEDNGELMHGSVHGNAKQVLLELQRLAESGVINADFATNDMPWQNTLDAILNEQTGLVFGHCWFGEWIENNRGARPRTPETATWTCVSIPGLSGTPNAVPTAARTGSVTCVRSGFAYPELAVKMVNLTLGLLEGDIAQAQYRSVPGEDNTNINTSGLAMASGGNLSDNHRSDLASAVIGALNSGDSESLTGGSKVLYTFCKAWLDSQDPASYGSFTQYGPGGSQTVLADMRARSLLLPDAYYGPTTPAIKQNWATLMEKRDEAYRNIISGDNVERAFESYIKFFSENGGKEITREVNDWFAAQ